MSSGVWSLQLLYGVRDGDLVCIDADMVGRFRRKADIDWDVVLRDAVLVDAADRVGHLVVLALGDGRSAVGWAQAHVLRWRDRAKRSRHG